MPRRFVEFEVVTQGDSEYEEEGVTPSYADVNEVTFFYATSDGGTIVEFDNGNGFKTTFPIEEVLRLINE